MSTQDSNNNPQKRNSSQIEKNRNEKGKDRRNYTEYVNRNMGRTIKKDE